MKRQTKAGETAWKGFEDLKTWQLARRLMVECHKLANELPSKERYDLAPQIRRSSKSVMANIAEGYGRYHYMDSLRFYYIARGSLEETINHIITAHDLAYVNDVRFQELYNLGRETERTLNGYINTSANSRLAARPTATSTSPRPMNNRARSKSDPRHLFTCLLMYLSTHSPTGVIQ